MAFSIKATLQAIHSHLVASGYATASVGEPKSPPGGVHAAVYMSSVSVLRAMLDGATEELHVATIRLYRPMLEEPLENMEYLMAEATSQIMASLLGEFDLGASIRNVDATGQNGTPVRADFGYVDLGGVMFRTADITVPMVVDGSVTMAA